MSAPTAESPSPLDSTLPSNPLPALPAPPQPSTNPRRLPPPCWSHDETVALIDAYCDKWYTLRRGNLKANHWQEVAEAVARRCPAASPPKTAVQCRHKMEKLRKRYRTEIQRARSMPVSRFSSSWVHFKRMDAMEKGPQAKVDYNSESDGDDNEDENEDDDENQGFYMENHRNVSTIMNTRSIHKLYRNGIGGNTGSNVSGSGSGASVAGGFRIRIPTGVSIAQPGPKFYPKVDHNKVLRGSDETGKKREREPMEEMVTAIKEVCLQKLQSHIDVAYDSSIPKHQWKEMGWQGKDPSTDFRVGGFISLENLIFARNFPQYTVFTRFTSSHSLSPTQSSS
ncbi:hypothetical protein GH714_039353 [Hevea brasiliensis]|uniref:ELMO domain-containing protein n=1 Tax=Hevea brasiliensis TaxID=3981 RepID=A0A6A6MFU2_HEVBR|nr:hypothetical protein GH714_039353 [Hevea brasiliensis]